MKTRHTSALLASAAALALAACGGGALLLLGFIGSAGGDWIQDDPNQAGFQPLDTCGQFGNERCGINIQPVGADPLYASAFDVTYNSATLPNCPLTGTGRADGRKLTLDGCFSGAYVSINEAVSDDGKVRMFFDFTPPLAGGVWTELQQGVRRFAFSDNSTGCELGTPNVAVTVVLSPSNILAPAGPLETTIQSFTIAGQGGAWSGKFVGVSGMRLTRGSEVLELERRQGSQTC